MLKTRIPEIFRRHSKYDNNDVLEYSLTVDTCTGLSEKRERGGGERMLDVDILLVSGLLLFSLDSGRGACV